MAVQAGPETGPAAKQPYRKSLWTGYLHHRECGSPLPNAESQSVFEKIDRILLLRVRAVDCRQPAPAGAGHHGEATPMPRLFSLSAKNQARELSGVTGSLSALQLRKSLFFT
jgi:hypothetical protein